MPSSDLILNVKQIFNYTQSGLLPGDVALIQRGGIGGPYFNVPAYDFVAEAMASGDGVPMTVGFGAPADAIGGQIFTGGVNVPDGGWFGWNTSDNGGVVKPIAITSPAGLISFGAFGWNFNVFDGAGNQKGAMELDPTGHLNVVDQVEVGRNPMLPMEVATMQWVTETLTLSLAIFHSLYQSATVWSFNNRIGNVILNVCDIMAAGGAPIQSPAFLGQPTAPNPAAASNDNSIATTQWVLQHMSTSAVQSFNGRTGAVVLTSADVSAAGGLANPNVALTGVPTAPTALSGTDTTQIATTAFVTNAVATLDLSDYAPLNSPNFSGSPTAPTPPPAASDGRIATTAFVHNAVVAATSGVSSFNTRTGAVVLNTADITSAGGAVLASPQFTGVPTAPTAALNTNTTQIATTAFVMAELAGGGNVTSFNGRTGAVVLQTADITGAGGAPIASPALTGTPTAPTATIGTSTTQVATTQFVANALASIGTTVTSFNGRSGAVTLTANDVSAAGGAVLASPAFSGVPTAPTAAPGTSTSQLATTSFVMSAIAGGVGVSSFNGRTGAVTLTGGDVSGAGGALTVSPTFTGTPSGPTAAVGTNTTQLATTAFVAAALVNNSVSSFNARTGAVTLQASDITGAGGAVLASPSFSGVPTAPTPATTDNTNTIATTAFVQSVVNTIGAGVVSFNGRTGVVNLIANDISAAGGAVLASPAFTGTPTAPTASVGNNSTQLATTAFVTAAIAAGGYLPLTGGTLTGSVVAAGGASFSAAGFAAFAAGGLWRSFTGSTGSTAATASLRWAVVMGDSTTESGSSAGSNFLIQAYNDSGTASPYGAAVQIYRSSNAFVLNSVNMYLSRASGAAGTTTVYNICGPGGFTGTTYSQWYFNTTDNSVTLTNNVAGQSIFLTSASGFSTSGAASIGGVLTVLGNATLNWNSGNGLVLNNANANAYLQINSSRVLSYTGASINFGVSTVITGQLQVNGSNTILFNSSYGLYPLVNNATYCGFAGQAWYSVAAYGFPLQSDERDKTDITLAPPGALDAVLKIPVHNFFFRQEQTPSGRRIGWLAQEVQAVRPENVVVGPDEKKMLGVELGAMIATLWEAVQELTAKVAVLEAAA